MGFYTVLQVYDGLYRNDRDVYNIENIYICEYICIIYIYIYRYYDIYVMLYIVGTHDGM